MKIVIISNYVRHFTTVLMVSRWQQNFNHGVGLWLLARSSSLHFWHVIAAVPFTKIQLYLTLISLKASYRFSFLGALLKWFWAWLRNPTTIPWHACLLERGTSPLPPLSFGPLLNAQTFWLHSSNFWTVYTTIHFIKVDPINWHPHSIDWMEDAHI